MTSDNLDRIVVIDHRTIMGVTGCSPEETNVEKGLNPRTPVELRAWPRDGRLYLSGLRTENGKGDDLHLRILHPRSKEPLFQGDAWRLNPDADTDLVTWEGMFIRIFAPHVKGGEEPAYCSEQEPLLIEAVGSLHVKDGEEPAYCSEQEPLLIEAVGSVPVSIAVFGSEDYMVFDPRTGTLSVRFANARPPSPAKALP